MQIGNELTYLAQERNQTVLWDNLSALNRKIIQIHTSDLPPEQDDTHSIEWWGSTDQIEEKLLFNLSRLDLVLEKNALIQILPQQELESTLSIFKENMLKMFSDLKPVISQRKHLVKSLHGDLKRKNIFIQPTHSLRKPMLYDAQLIDSIDFNFNLAFSNIPPESDYAMLTMDMLVGTGKKNVVERMLKDYADGMEAAGQPINRRIFSSSLWEKLWAGLYVEFLFHHPMADRQAIFKKLIRIILLCKRFWAINIHYSLSPNCEYEDFKNCNTM